MRGHHLRPRRTPHRHAPRQYRPQPRGGELRRLRRGERHGGRCSSRSVESSVREHPATISDFQMAPRCLELRIGWLIKIQTLGVSGYSPQFDLLRLAFYGQVGAVRLLPRLGNANRGRSDHGYDRHWNGRHPMDQVCDLK